MVNKEVRLIHKGLIDYKECFDFQTDLFNSIVQHKIALRKGLVQEQNTPNYFIFCEHPHVYTLGKTGDESNLLVDRDALMLKGASFYPINRGGDITYHGPGQIVGYPILDLDNFFTDINRYLRLLEESVILTLKNFGIQSGRVKGLTGVWIDGDDPSRARKICALGVKLSRWVTMHGFAFNINTDLSYFDHIVPCGISDKSVTSLERELGSTQNIQEVQSILLNHLINLFEFKIVL
ncbi:MAG: lipoyl(octanoyl) transferase [Flavobacteriales bacterium]|nr:lipoyl(octanoyl) transferase [Flavobacteriales bacterium]